MRSSKQDDIFMKRLSHLEGAAPSDAPHRQRPEPAAAPQPKRSDPPQNGPSGLAWFFAISLLLIGGSGAAYVLLTETRNAQISAFAPTVETPLVSN